jgi:predicted DNA-binding transcriptional regulator AlpA
MTLRPTPTLDTLDHEQIGGLTPVEAVALLRDCEARVAFYQGLRDALLIRACAGNSIGAARKDDGDRFLDAAEIGRLIRKSPSWIAHNIDELPERIRIGGEGRWSEREIRRWMASRPRWSEQPD